MTTTKKPPPKVTSIDKNSRQVPDTIDPGDRTQELMRTNPTITPFSVERSLIFDVLGHMKQQVEQQKQSNKDQQVINSELGNATKRMNAIIFLTLLVVLLLLVQILR